MQSISLVGIPVRVSVDVDARGDQPHEKAYSMVHSPFPGNCDAESLTPSLQLPGINMQKMMGMLAFGLAAAAQLHLSHEDPGSVL